MAPWNKMPPAKRGAILEDYRRGEKVDVIAVRYGVSRTTPRALAARAGLPPRPTHNNPRRRPK